MGTTTVRELNEKKITMSLHFPLDLTPRLVSSPKTTNHAIRAYRRNRFRMRRFDPRVQLIYSKRDLFLTGMLRPQ